MRITKTLLVGGLLFAGAGFGCGGGGYDPVAHAEKDKIEAAWAGKKMPEYQEIKGKDGKIYVVGSAATAEAVKKGEKPKLFRTAFGYGPNKETVVFEENKDGILADYLEKEFKAKQGKSI